MPNGVLLGADGATGVLCLHFPCKYLSKNNKRFGKTNCCSHPFTLHKASSHPIQAPGLELHLLPTGRTPDPRKVRVEKWRNGSWKNGEMGRGFVVLSALCG